jgi:hypothetical protein
MKESVSGAFLYLFSESARILLLESQLAEGAID